MNTALNVTTLAPRNPLGVVASTSQDDVVVGHDGIRYRPHRNGGGLVATTAFVELSVYVGPDAIVRGNASVRGRCRILGHAVVEGRASISGLCTLRGTARVCEGAQLRGRVTVSHFATVGGQAFLEGHIQVEFGAIVNGRTFIVGRMLIE